MTLCEIIKDWIAKHASTNLEYDSIVASTVWEFKIRDLLHGSKVTLVLLPEIAWDRKKIFLENPTIKKVAYFDEFGDG